MRLLNIILDTFLLGQNNWYQMNASQNLNVTSIHRVCVSKLMTTMSLSFYEYFSVSLCCEFGKISTHK